MGGPVRRVIGLETSGEVCAVALLSVPAALWRAGPHRARDILARAEIKEREAGGDGARHSEAIYGLLDAVLGRAVRLGDVDLLCVSQGPGSFTGLRVGLAVAKTLGRFGGLSVIGVPTLKAAAFSACVRDGASLHAPVLDARRGEVYAAVYRSGRSGMRQVRKPKVLEREALAAWLPRGAVVLDESRPSASAVAALGAADFLSRGADDPVRLLPIYVRRPEAVEKLKLRTRAAQQCAVKRGLAERRAAQQCAVRRGSAKHRAG